MQNFVANNSNGNHPNNLNGDNRHNQISFSQGQQGPFAQATTIKTFHQQQQHHHHQVSSISAGHDGQFQQHFNQQQHNQVSFSQQAGNGFMQQSHQSQSFQQRQQMQIAGGMQPVQYVRQQQQPFQAHSNNQSQKLIEVEDVSSAVPQQLPIMYQTSQQPSPSVVSGSARADKRQLTNLLSHLDGQMLLQEILLHSSPLSNGLSCSLSEEGVPTALDMQAIWGKSNGRMLLSVRMQNNANYGVDVEELLMSFAPNACGLNLTNVDYNHQAIKCGATSGMALQIQFDVHNQQLREELLAVDIGIEYTIVSCQQPQKRKRLHFVHQTVVPMHIFLQDHPQRKFVNNGRENGPVMEDLSMLSISDDGPRMTQSAFLDKWHSSNTMPVFEIDGGYPVEKWCQLFGLDKQAAIEHKLAVNRIYNVATRQLRDENNMVELCMYSSFKIVSSSGGNGGVLLMAEFRFSSDRCTVQVRGQLSEKLFGGLERAIRGILLS